MRILSGPAAAGAAARNLLTFPYDFYKAARRPSKRALARARHCAGPVAARQRGGADRRLSAEARPSSPGRRGRGRCRAPAPTTSETSSGIATSLSERVKGCSVTWGMQQRARAEHGAASGTDDLEAVGVVIPALVGMADGDVEGVDAGPGEADLDGRRRRPRRPRRRSERRREAGKARRAGRRHGEEG